MDLSVPTGHVVTGDVVGERTPGTCGTWGRGQQSLDSLVKGEVGRREL